VRGGREREEKDEREKKQKKPTFCFPLPKNSPPQKKNPKSPKSQKQQDNPDEVCPAGWTPGAATMKPTPGDSKEYFKAL
jgi:hypothetical protein